MAVTVSMIFQDALRIFRRVQKTESEGKVLDAIRGKAHIYGKYVKIAYPAWEGAAVGSPLVGMADPQGNPLVCFVL